MSVNKKLLNVLPNDDVLSQCIHCGMCLATCPTYNLTKVERSSPRGRIKMIKAVARGEMEISPTFAEEMDFCLDCQACETACPAGVHYGQMVEAARVEVEHAGFSTWWGQALKSFALKYLLKYKGVLNIAAGFLLIYQKTIKSFLHKSGLFGAILPKLGEMDKLAPTINTKFSSSIIKEVENPVTEQKFKTAFLFGCVMDVGFADINVDTVEVLKKCGSVVYTPKDQVCCGSIHAHNGDMETAKELAKKNIDSFGRYEYDYLVSNSAGCGAFMKEYGHVLADDPAYAEKAKLFSSKVKDVSEFLYENLSSFKLNPVNESVTYHDACHLVHTQKITEQPRSVLNAIPGLKNTPLTEASWCCGSAGVYNIMRYDDSMKILQKKMENIRNTGADTVLAANPGCILQLIYGAEKFNVNVKVKHPVSIVRKSME
ncbi:MAG: (Fe-S)-binding protein [Bacteroidota bacterium]|nr:(Fe-S)-binding protein [Bacteroidota bacterium]